MGRAPSSCGRGGARARCRARQVGGVGRGAATPPLRASPPPSASRLASTRSHPQPTPKAAPDRAVHRARSDAARRSERARGSVANRSHAAGRGRRSGSGGGGAVGAVGRSGCARRRARMRARPGRGLRRRRRSGARDVDGCAVRGARSAHGAAEGQPPAPARPAADCAHDHLPRHPSPPPPPSGYQHFKGRGPVIARSRVHYWAAGAGVAGGCYYVSCLEEVPYTHR
jgi:hypothetical protein